LFDIADFFAHPGLPPSLPDRKMFKRSRSGRGTNICGWQQFVVRERAVGLRTRRTSVLGWQQCAVRGRAFGLRARTASAQE